MSVRVAIITVDLVANTATFEGPLENATKKGKSSAKEIEQSFNGIDLSEGRGTLALIDEDLGIKLPRHVRSFIAELPGVSTALSAAFPAAALVTLGLSIFENIEHLGKLKEELRKTRDEWDSTALSILKHAESLEISNLHLKDQMSVLEGLPARNKPAEALLEIKTRAIELTGELKKTIEQQSKLLEQNSIGFFGSIFKGQQKTTDLEDEFGPKLEHIQELLAEKRSAIREGKQEEIKATDEAYRNALEKTRSEIDERKKGLEAEKAKATFKEFGGDAKGFSLLTQKSFDNTSDPKYLAAVDSVNKSFATRKAVIDNLSLSISSLQAIESNQSTNEELEKRKAGDDALHAKIEFLNKSFAESKKELDAEAKETVAYNRLQFEQHKITAGQLEVVKQQQLDKQFKMELDHLEHIKSLQSGIPALAEETNKQIETLQHNHNAQIYGDGADATKKQTELMQTFTKFIEEDARKRESILHHTTEETLKQTERTNKSTLNFIHLAATPGLSRQFIDSVLLGSDALEKFNRQTQIAQAIQNFKKDNPGLSNEKNAEALGFIREQVEMQDELAAAQKVASEKHISQIEREIQALEKLRAKAVERGQSTTAIDALLHNDSVRRQLDLNKELIETGQLGKVFKGTLQQMATEGRQWQTQMAHVFQSTLGSMNRATAQFLVENKGDWRSLAAGAIEQIAEIGLQWVESHVLMAVAHKIFGTEQETDNAEHTALQLAANVVQAQSAAGLAGANALASMSIIDPFLAMAVAEAVFAEGELFAGLASASQGAKLPNREMLVHTHPEEMILPKHISNFIEDAANNAVSGGGGGVGQYYVQPVFAPKIYAIDATGVDKMLTQHGTRFARHVASEIRKMNL